MVFSSFILPQPLAKATGFYLILHNRNHSPVAPVRPVSMLQWQIQLLPSDVIIEFLKKNGCFSIVYWGQYFTLLLLAIYPVLVISCLMKSMKEIYSPMCWWLSWKIFWIFDLTWKWFSWVQPWMLRNFQSILVSKVCDWYGRYEAAAFRFVLKLMQCYIQSKK